MPNPTSYTWDTQSDLTGPVISLVEVIDAFTIRVIYNEPVVIAEATNALNYTFTGGLVAQSVVSETAASYVVTTSEQTPATSYTVTVNNIHDLIGNLV